MMTILLYYLINPVPVEYYDKELDDWFKGIAYRDEIIDISSGQVLKIRDIYVDDVEPEPIRVLDSWFWSNW